MTVTQGAGKACSSGVGIVLALEVGVDVGVRVKVYICQHLIYSKESVQVQVGFEMTLQASFWPFLFLP